jgi:Tfp pilus assembly protein PilX
MRMRTNHKQQQREQGSVLVLALLVSLLLAGLGLATMWTATQNTKVSGNLTRRGEAFNAALSGLERARAILAGTTASWDPLLAGCGGPTDTTRGVLLCAGGTPLQDVQVVDASTTSATVAAGLGNVTYTIWIRNDDQEGMGNPDNDDRVIVRSEGTGRDGISFVALEGVLAKGAQAGLQEGAYSQSGMSSTGSNSAKASLN